MKNIWALIIKTSLPNTAEDVTELNTKVQAFESFEDAKNKLREKLKEYAFTKNAMFDGKGGLILLKNYIDNNVNDDEDYEETDDILTLTKIKYLEEALKGIFEGKNKQLEMEKIDCCTDWFVTIDVISDSVKMYGCDDGPCNGYDPRIKTNMFDMTEEKDYYLYIDDMFGQDDASSELYIDLIQTTLG